MSKVSAKISTAGSKARSSEKKSDIFDQYRPRTGIRYEIEQTNADYDAGDTKIRLKQTTVEYEAGQDLKGPSSSATKKMGPRTGRGPVWEFKEERDELKKNKTASQKNDKRKIKYQAILQEQEALVHAQIMKKIGPKWYHELSNKQMQDVDRLLEAMQEDIKHETTTNTQYLLADLGLTIWSHNRKVDYCLKKYNLCPVQFLLTMYRLSHSSNAKQQTYSLNDKIILSCVVHLEMRTMLRELHLRIPSPPRKQQPPPKPKPEPPKKKENSSPYLTKLVFKSQKKKKVINRNRCVIPNLVYFDYMDDMYDVSSEVVSKPIGYQPADVKITKYNRPPSIPVRMTKSKISRRKVFTLKKPSPYIPPCGGPVKKQPIAEPVKTASLCKCSPEIKDPTAEFDLNVTVTTSKEELVFTQKLCPYNPICMVGEMKLLQQKNITPTEPKLVLLEVETENGPEMKQHVCNRVEYSCECCICKKVLDMNNVKKIIAENLEEQSKEFLDKEEFQVKSKGSDQAPTTEGVSDEFEENYKTVEEQVSEDSKFCKCKSETEMSQKILFANTNIFYQCNCESTTNVSTCCVCSNYEKLMKGIKKYNEINNTNLKPCVCNCTCKKKKSAAACSSEPGTSKEKYCFCTKETPFSKKLDEMEKTIAQSKPIETEPEQLLEQEVELQPILTTNKKYKEKEKNLVVALKDITTISHSDMHLDYSEQEEEEETECKCAKLFKHFMHSHESCMELFSGFQQKVNEDLKEYYKDLETRCTCGDQLYEESKSDSESRNQNLNPPPDFKGCDCGCYSGNNDLACGCRCGASVMPGQQEIYTCDCGRIMNPQLCICKKSNSETQTEMSQSVPQLAKTDPKAKQPVKYTKREAYKPDLTPIYIISNEPDPRIIRISEFPSTFEDQISLLKQALDGLAADNYPLAKLPDCYQLPHFRIWLLKRSHSHISQEDTDKILSVSKNMWNHTSHCFRQIDTPKMKDAFPKSKSLTWDGRHKYGKIVEENQNKFYRLLKQAHIDEAQELFPSMFHYELPNKSFRDCYFAYLPADENHIFAFRPWQKHEIINRLKRVSCLCR